MLKKFFISMLGTIAGVWIAFFIAVIACFSIFGAIVASFGSSDATNDLDASVLYLDLKGVMEERTQTTDVWSAIKSSKGAGETYIDVLDALRLAANDSKIEGVYINANGLGAGVSTFEELVAALRDFKETSGKWVIAYGDSYGQGDYLLASVADSVYLNPFGGVSVRGMATQTPFLKGLLDKLGVKMQILRVGTFKSAVEPFMNTEMSPASRLQSQVMVDSLWAYYCDVVSVERGVDEADVKSWAENMMMTWEADKILESGAVTALLYERQVNDVIREKCGVESGDDLPLITPSKYLMLNEGNNTETKNEAHVAVLFAAGDIVDSGEGGIVGDAMVPEILDLADDDNVKGLVLRVNSGGGSAYASEQIWEALEYFKSKGKPFYVSMGDYAASGGYYISCGADKIYADQTTLTGSIGVFGMMPEFSGLVTGKLGVTFSTVQTNENAAFPSSMEPMTAKQRDAMQAGVNGTYDKFTKRVADGRGMSQDSVKMIAEGRVWVGGSALELGLVDEIGGLNETLAAMLEKTELTRKNVVYYPEIEDEQMVKMLREALGGISINDITVDANTINMMKLVDDLRTMSPIQARMEPIEIIQ